MPDTPSTYDWFEYREGRASERSRRLTFLILFTPEGRPTYWLVALGLLGALVAGLGFGGL